MTWATSVRGAKINCDNEWRLRAMTQKKKSEARTPRTSLFGEAPPPPPSYKITEAKRATWALFHAFWNIYPRKDGKRQAWGKWQALKPTRATLDAIKEDLATRDWVMPYVPYAKTYLFNQLWEERQQKPSFPEPEIESPTTTITQEQRDQVARNLEIRGLEMRNGFIVRKAK